MIPHPDTRSADDGDSTISHFIPSVELTGSRLEKLRKLDTLIVYLEQLRRRLAHGASGVPGTSSARGLGVDRSGWYWLAAGIVIGALCGSLIVAAYRSGL